MNSRQILIIQEKEVLLNFLVSVLRPDYRILIANTAFEALRILDKDRVDLVISDVAISQVEGGELCSRIKAGADTNHLPVILLDSKSTLQSRVKSLELGADAYLEVPISASHIKAQVSNLLANRKRVLEYFSRVPLTAATTMAQNRDDRRFLEKLSSQVLNQIDNSDFGMAELADSINVSRITLYRKIKSLCNMTPLEFIHMMRLQKGAELLASKRYRVYEVAIMVGYKSQTQFGRVFQKQFGVTPRQFSDTSGA